MQLGPFKVHWYGIMYLFGFGAGWLLARRRAAQPGSTWKPVDVDDLVFFAMVGGVLGGRLGYVLIYGLSFWTAQNPWYPFEIWDGGMSIHGGFIGAIIALVLFAWTRGRSVADVFDFTVPLPAARPLLRPHGQFHQRRALGQADDSAMGLRRRPEAPVSLSGEQCVRGVRALRDYAMHSARARVAALRGVPRRHRALHRDVVVHLEIAPAVGALRSLPVVLRHLSLPHRVRAHAGSAIGYLAWGWLTMGQVLSLPMILIGGALLTYAYSARAPSGNFATAQ